MHVSCAMPPAPDLKLRIHKSARYRTGKVSSRCWFFNLPVRYLSSVSERCGRVTLLCAAMGTRDFAAAAGPA